MTMSELNAEYHALSVTHRRLIAERDALRESGADGAAFRDHDYRTRVYVNALNEYITKLQARRRELRHR